MIIGELGGSERTLGHSRRKSANARSLTDWRSAANAAKEVELTYDSRLPTIKEGKQFPRRTMNAEEIRDIVNAGESPDLGPPPVAHFQDEDPIKFDPPARRVPDEDVRDYPEDPLSTPISVNLESRRKRREGTPRVTSSVTPSETLDIKAEVKDALPLDTRAAQPSQPSLPIRSGTKRKLSSREVDDGHDSASSSAAQDTPDFIRKASSTRREGQETDTTASILRDRIRASKSASDRVLPKPSTTERKALGVKSVNTDPVVSPRKASKEKLKDKPQDIEELKKSVAPLKTLERRKTARAPDVEMVPLDTSLPPVETADIVFDTINLPPKTPAGLDLFSPSTAPSTAGPRDTPEPNASLGDALAAGRPGRRARSQVNYAEPSLNTKMRRPTKDMVDAVSKTGKPAAIRAEPRIKQDRESAGEINTDWKNLPVAEKESDGIANSPLLKKATSLILPTFDSVGAEREKRRSFIQLDNEPEERALQDPGTATTALRKKLGRPAQVLPAVISDAHFMPEEKRDSLAIFDFTDTSPQDGLRTSSRTLSSRRHSSTTPSLQAPGTGSRTAGGGNDGLVRSKTMKSLTTASRLTAPSTVTDSIEGARQERLAARRRSMML